MKAAGVGRGDEVVVPTYTFCASANVVEHLGAKPVFIDSEPNTMNLDTNLLDDVLSEKTKAVMPVHFAGQPADMDKVLEFSKNHNLFVVEDAAHAINSEFMGKKIGNLSDATCFSFYATKNITTGDGGALVTNNDKLAEKISLLRLHGLDKGAWKRYASTGSWRYDVVEAGYKMNLTDLQAAVGIVQINKLEEFTERRIELANYYLTKLQNLDFLELPKHKGNRKHVFHLFPVFLKEDALKINRNKFIEALKAEKIGTSVHFIPVHSFTYYRKKYGYREGDYPVAWNYFSREISLPMFNGMTEKDVEDVVTAVKKIGVFYSK